MSTDQALAKMTEKILSTCTETWKLLEKHIDSQTTESLPLYNELRDPEFFTNVSAKYTEMSRQNYFLKMKVAKMSIDITTLINEIARKQLTSVVQKNLTDLKTAKDKCSMYADALDDYQKGLNQVLKYLEMSSYTMNSPYRG